MHNDGTQGGPCQVFRGFGEKPWEGHSFHAGILVYVETGLISWSNEM